MCFINEAIINDDEFIKIKNTLYLIARKRFAVIKGRLPSGESAIGLTSYYMGKSFSFYETSLGLHPSNENIVKRQIVQTKLTIEGIAFTSTFAAELGYHFTRIRASQISPNENDIEVLIPTFTVQMISESELTAETFIIPKSFADYNVLLRLEKEKRKLMREGWEVIDEDSLPMSWRDYLKTVEKDGDIVQLGELEYIHLINTWLSRPASSPL